MKPQLKKWIWLGMLLTAGALIYVWRFRPPARAPSFAVNEGIGAGLAQAVTQVADRPQEVVLLSASVSNLAEMQEREQGFQKALQQKGGFRLVATERVPTGQAVTDDPWVSATPLLATLEKYSNVALFASLVDLPDLSATEAGLLRERNITFVVFVSNPAPRVREWVRKGIVRAVIVPNSSPPPASGTPQSAAEWFAWQYEIVTAQELDRLPR